MRSWKPPPLGIFKLNTDGASSSACGVAGCGGLIRDSNGFWKGGYSKSLGFCTAYIAELWGVLEGINMARRLGVTHLIVELDAEEIIKALNNNKQGRGAGWRLMNKIRTVLQDTSWCIEFQHSYREANNCAHSLAIMGSYQIEDFRYYDVMPMELSNACSDHIKGAATPRIVAI